MPCHFAYMFFGLVNYNAAWFCDKAWAPELVFMFYFFNNQTQDYLACYNDIYKGLLWLYCLQQKPWEQVTIRKKHS